MFCVVPNRPPVLAVAPKADVPKPPVAPNPASESKPEEETDYNSEKKTEYKPKLSNFNFNKVSLNNKCL